MKSCNVCQTNLPLLAFVTDNSCKNNKGNICKPCDSLRRKAWGKRNPNSQRKAYLKHYYSLSLEDYNKMFEDQKGCCALCGKHQTAEKKTLSVDHCHITGKIRGLLCHYCNISLGYYENNKTRLHEFEAYVNRNSPLERFTNG